MVFIVLLRGFELPSLVALFLALVFAAGQTFVLSRFWAFRR
jgi:putative flippase GtrA